MFAEYELMTTFKGEFVFSLRFLSGGVLLTSEPHTNKVAALTDIYSCRTNCELDMRYECKTDLNGQFYFILKAVNERVLGRSEMHASESACARAIASVKQYGTDALIVERRFS